jgi:hypothetical protein
MELLKVNTRLRETLNWRPLNEGYICLSLKSSREAISLHSVPHTMGHAFLIREKKKVCSEDSFPEETMMRPLGLPEDV